jgi:glycosyltransferase involved in cell wall biosynthesis
MERHVLQLAGNLVKRGFRVAAICTAREEVRPLREGLAAGGVRVHALPERESLRLGPVQRLWYLTQTVRAYPACVLHIHRGDFHGGELVQLAGSLGGARAIVRTEHLPPWPPTSLPHRAWVRTRDRFLARVICASAQNRREYIEKLGRDPQKLTVIHYGVDVARFSPEMSGEDARRELELAGEVPLVGTVARLDPQKGLSHFLEMAAAVGNRYPDVHFLVVGDGPLRAALEAQARDLGIAQRVHFVGARRDVPRWLAAMSVFVMPSTSEGGPITLLEAMAMARPVVSTPVGLAPEVVQDDVSGLLVPVEDPDSLARAVLGLLDDPVRSARLGGAARDVMVHQMSLEAMTDKVISVYESAG